MATESYGNKIFTPKYIVLYLVFAVVVYGLVYYVWKGKSGGGYMPSNYNTQPSETVMPSVTTMMQKSMTVELMAQNNSSESGTAVLTEENGQTKVVLTLTGGAKGVAQPAHIHMGACPKVGDVKYPLTNVVDGASETVVPVTMDTLKSMMPLAINVHKSSAQAGLYVSCGDLK